MTAVIFDMDGTLLRLDVDIEEVRTRLAARFRPYGVTQPFRPILRRIREAALEATAAGGDAYALMREGLALLSEWELRAAPNARAREGATAVVEALATSGTPLGLVTDNGRACVAPALGAAGIDAARFAVTITRDDVAEPKPDPAGILAAAAALGAPRVFYVGDHPRDVQAARAAGAELPGLKVIGLSGGYATASQLEAAGADHLVASLAEIAQIVHGA